MSKLNLITSELRQRIVGTGIRTGQLVPTHKQLARELGVGVGTVRRAMSFLQREGLVVATRGLGTAVANAPVKASPGRLSRLGVIMTAGNADNATLGPLMRETQAICAAQGISLELFSSSSEHDTGDLLAWSSGIEAILVFGDVTPDFISALQVLGKPTLFSRELRSGRCPIWAGQLSMDMDSVASTALQFLMTLGHRRILLARDRGTFYLENLGASFENVAAELGIEESLGQVFVPRDSMGGEVLSAIQSSEGRYTAVVVVGGIRSGQVLHALLKAGITVPDQISLLALNGVDPALLVTPDLSRIEHNPVKEAKQLVQMASDMCLNPALLIHKSISPTIVWGKTCAKID